MCSVHWGRYHEYIGISWVHWGMFSTLGDIMMHVGDKKPFNLYWKPWCTEHPPIYSWYPPHTSWYPPDVLMKSPNVLMISPWCTHDIPRCTHGILNVLMVSPMYSWYPPMYWTSPIYWTCIQGVYAWLILCHILLTADKILNQIKSKISSQPKLEESMTQQTAWFRTYAIRTDPSPPPPPCRFTC